MLPSRHIYAFLFIQNSVLHLLHKLVFCLLIEKKKWKSYDRDISWNLKHPKKYFLFSCKIEDEKKIITL